jgi:TonB family protein
VYNVDALRVGLEGRVTLAAEIRTDGVAHKIRVIHGLGAGLDEQAVDCLRQWTFRPAVGPDGNPVTAHATIQIEFSLKNSK